MTVKVQALIDKRAKAWGEAQEIRARLDDEKYELSDEDKATFERALEDVGRIDSLVELEERAAAIEKLDRSTDPAPAAPTRVQGGDGADAAAYRDAFRNFLRRGANRLSPDEQTILERGFETFEDRAQGTPDAAGGYTIPDEFVAKMTETRKAFGGLLSLVDVMETTTGAPIQWPSNDDTGNVGAILAENTQVTEQDLVFGTVTLGAYMYTSKMVRVSRQLLQDSAFNLDNWLPRKLETRIMRAVAAHVANGSGVAQPQGVTAATVGETTAVSATPVITYENILDLEHSLDPEYRTNARFVMHDSVLRMVRGLLDGDDRPIWVPSLQEGVPSLINGRPYTIDNSMPTAAAESVSAVFGDFAEGYTARKVRGGQVLRLEERYADYLQVGFLGFERWDGKITDANALRALVFGDAA